MDSLRERVAKAMHECHPENDPKPWDWVVTDATRYAESIRQDADAAIAAFEAALLSDEVVESAAKVAVYCEGDDWERMVSDSPTVADAHIEVARRQLQAAIAAAKSTEVSE